MSQRRETIFALAGDLILVEAVVVGPAGRTETALLLDTGAAFTTLAPAVAKEIGFTEATALQRTVTRTAAALEQGYLVRLEELSTLGFSLPGLLVNVADLGYGLDGVIGINFLRLFHFEIRYAERRIFVEPAEP